MPVPTDGFLKILLRTTPEGARFIQEEEARLAAERSAQMVTEENLLELDAALEGLGQVLATRGWQGQQLAKQIQDTLHPDTESE